MPRINGRANYYLVVAVRGKPGAKYAIFTTGVLVFRLLPAAARFAQRFWYG